MPSNTQASGVAYSDPEFTTCYASQEIGYSLAAQGSVTQLTDKSTAVTLNKSAGQITMNNASLATVTTVSFTLNNSTISAKDTLIVCISSGATTGAYLVYVSNLTAGSATISLRNFTAGSLAEAVVVNFAIIHSGT
jgi:catabolite regulation protein CreA